MTHAPALRTIDETHVRVKECAFETDYSVQSVYRWIQQGRLPAVKIGGAIWIDRRVVAAIPRRPAREDDMLDDA